MLGAVGDGGAGPANETGSAPPGPLPADAGGGVAWNLGLQRAVGRLLSPLWVPLLVVLMRLGMRWRIDGVEAVRREYRNLVAAGGPILVCANHLTLVDSALVAWALGSPAWYLARYAALPWNVPERRNFAESIGSRALVYLMKCV